MRHQLEAVVNCEKDWKFLVNHLGMSQHCARDGEFTLRCHFHTREGEIPDLIISDFLKNVTLSGGKYSIILLGRGGKPYYEHHKTVRFETWVTVVAKDMYDYHRFYGPAFREREKEQWYLHGQLVPSFDSILKAEDRAKAAVEYSVQHSSTFVLDSFHNAGLIKINRQTRENLSIIRI